MHTLIRIVSGLSKKSRMITRETHIHDRRGEMPINPRQRARLRSEEMITHGIIHHTGVWGKTADQHARYHTSLTGRNWPTVAYTSYVGLDARRELLLDYFTVGYHCKGVNTKSIGIVVEGNYDEKQLPQKLIDAIVEECLWHEAQLGRRLVWTWHNVIRPGWICPGKFFPKDEILSRIESEYIEAEGEDPIIDVPVTEEPNEPTEEEEEEEEEEEPIDPPSGCTIQPLLILALICFGAALAFLP